MDAKVVTICSSADFYEQACVVAGQLEERGIRVLLPETAKKMQASGNYNVADYKTWFDNAADYHKKTALIRAHFDEVARADAILVINNKKRGVANYIGGNVLMEMAVAFHLHLPIYLLNDIPDESPFLEEIKGLEPIALQGNLEKLNF